MGSLGVEDCMANHKKEIDMKQLKELSAIQCTDGEICAVLGVSTEWLRVHSKKDSTIMETIKNGRDVGKTSLRRKQWQAAMGGSIPMMIWLGKQYLAQSDKQAVEGNVVYEERISRWLSGPSKEKAESDAPTIQ